ITVHNYGPSSSTGFSIGDTLSGDVKFKSQGGGCVFNNDADVNGFGGSVTCTRSTDLAVGSDAVFTLVVTSRSTLSPTSLLIATDGLANTASVTGTDPEPGSASHANSATAYTDLVRQADLGITKSDAPDPVVAGTDLTYTITVHNYGPSSSTGFTVSDTLPAGLTFKLTASGPNCTAVAQLVTCTRSSDLAVGANAVFTVVATAASSLLPTDQTDPTDGLVNTASVTGTDPEPAGASHLNSATAYTDVTREADLGITKTDNPDPVVAGNDLTYTITGHNYGPSSSTAFSVSDTLSADVKFKCQSGGCVLNNDADMNGFGGSAT